MKKLLLISLLVATTTFGQTAEDYIVGGGLDHPITHWAFPDQATMAGVTGLFSQDVNKVCYITGDKSYWILESVGTPSTWRWIMGYPFTFNGSSVQVSSGLVVSIPGDDIDSTVMAAGGFVSGSTPLVNGQFLQSVGGGAFNASTWRMPTTGGTSGQQLISAGTTGQATWGRAAKRISSAASAASLSPDLASFDIYRLTALTGALTINAPINAVDGDEVTIEIRNSTAAAHALSWNGAFSGTGNGVAILTTTGANLNQYVFRFLYISNLGLWFLINNQ